MNISQQNILKRWNLMASKDLGTDINPIARDMADLAKKVLKENMTQISLRVTVKSLFGRFMVSALITMLSLGMMKILAMSILKW